MEKIKYYLENSSGIVYDYYSMSEIERFKYIQKCYDITQHIGVCIFPIQEVFDSIEEAKKFLYDNRYRFNPMELGSTKICKLQEAQWKDIENIKYFRK